VTACCVRKLVAFSQRFKRLCRPQLNTVKGRFQQPPCACVSLQTLQRQGRNSDFPPDQFIAAGAGMRAGGWPEMRSPEAPAGAGSALAIILPLHTAATSSCTAAGAAQPHAAGVAPSATLKHTRWSSAWFAMAVRDRNGATAERASTGRFKWRQRDARQHTLRS